MPRPNLIVQKGKGGCGEPPPPLTPCQRDRTQSQPLQLGEHCSLLTPPEVQTLPEQVRRVQGHAHAHAPLHIGMRAGQAHWGAHGPRLRYGAHTHPACLGALGRLVPTPSGLGHVGRDCYSMMNKLQYTLLKGCLIS